MSGAAAKQERTTAKSRFTRAFNGVNNAFEAERVLPATVTKRYEALKEAWQIVQDKHEAFLATVEDESIFSTEEAWIDELMERFNTSENHVDLFFAQQNDATHQENASHAAEEKKLASKFKVEEVNREHQQERVIRDQRVLHCTQLCDRLERIVISKESGIGVEEIIKTGVMEMKSALAECKDTLESMIRSGNPDCNGKWLQELTSRSINVQDDCQRLCGNIRESKAAKVASSIKFDKLKFQHFTGNLRDYPRFKAEFQKHIQPSYNEDERAFVLKSYLPKNIQHDVQVYGEDLSAIWQRLDEKYGDKGKLVDAIMAEITKIKKDSEKDSDMLRLIETVNRANYELKQFGRESELNNSTIAGMIEERLSADAKRDWIKIATGPDREAISENKFPTLLCFLEDVRRRIEYSKADIRSSSSSVQGCTHHFDGSTETKQWCIIHDSSGHDICECRLFIDLSYEDKMKKAMDKGLCFSCLQPSHRIKDCGKRTQCSVDGCNRFHHPLLHENVIGGDSCHFDHHQGKRSCLLMLMPVKGGDDCATDMTLFWDTGSTVSLITFEKAKAMRLIGEEVTLLVTMVGGNKTHIKSAIYEVPLVDCNGKTHWFQSYGIERISSKIRGAPDHIISQIFSNVDPSLDIQRPVGEIDMLIGLDYAGYHPKSVHAEEHLLIYKNEFGTCVAGSHPRLTECTERLIQHVSVNFCQRIDISDFFSTEALGVVCSPRCGSCRCGTCPIGGKPYTIREERELKLIEDGLEHRGDHWVAHYPWVKDPKDLQNNYGVAKHMLAALERRLAKNPEHAKLFNDEIQDLIDRNAARIISEEEARNYDGPVYYIGFHEVLKEMSTTPIRVVFNSSATYKGQTLNDFWAKGPTLINSLPGILIRLRENKIAMIGDIRKMYHAVKIEGIDQHTHRFLWRQMDTSKPPVIHAMTSVTFGDRPAGNIAISALRKTVDMFGKEHPRVKDIITKNTYVDDVADSFDSQEEANGAAKEINDVLEKGGFQIKGWKFSNDPKEEDPFSTPGVESCVQAESLERVFGMIWDRENDEFRYDVHLNFSPKRRGIRSGPDILPHQIPGAIPKNLTKRMIISQVNGMWDPIGLACPFVLRAKILMKRLWMGEAKGLGWDDEIPNVLTDEWICFFSEIHEMRHVRFKRAMKPDNAVGDPILIVFMDGSGDAYGTCAYIRWSLEDNTFFVALVMAKSRVTPISNITPVRSELSGAILGRRVDETIQMECRFRFRKRYFLVDSQIVRAMVQLDTYGFNTFVATRIGEIQSSTKPDDWYWLEGKINIADWVTRGTKSPADIGMNSLWQRGPDFLYEPEEQWPIKQDVYSGELPEQIKRVFIVDTQVKNNDGFDLLIQRISSYDRLIRITARVISVGDAKSLKSIAQEPPSAAIKMAELLWVKRAQISITKAISEGKLKRLSPIVDDGIVVIGSRITDWSSFGYQGQPPPLLPQDHRLSRLYVEKVHNNIHGAYRGQSITTCKVRNRFWITQLPQLVRTVISKCVTCKKQQKKTESQIMGPLPNERLKPSPPFTSTGIDYFGPYQVRGIVNKRATGKVFGIIFNCAASRAVHIDLASDYSKEGFMMALRRFVALRGFPAKFVSDPGTQLKAASKELAEMFNDLERNMLIRFGAAEGSEWVFTPADAPWQNGATESLVKSVKNAIHGVVKGQRLTFEELQTVFYESANLVNERPIGQHPTDTESYLAPNHLLLGRATSRVPAGPFKEPSSNRQRFRLVQTVVNDFWKRWLNKYFPNLVIRQKWHTEYRNVCVGDVVMVQDSNAVRGEWRMALVSKVIPSVDDKVRRVEVQYKISDGDAVYGGTGFRYIERAVQKLIVIVPVEERSQESQNDD